jgi:hypothetical protein
LNLGLSHVWPGSVRWTGDRFVAQGIANKQPMLLSGLISRFTNNIPCEMTVCYSNTLGIARYRIAYEYHSLKPPLFPSRISMLLQTGGREIEYRSYEVRSLKRATRPMQEISFSPEAIQHVNDLPVKYLTNGSVFIRLPSGRLLEAGGVPAKLSLTAQDHYSNRYFYASALFLSAIFVFFAVRTHSNQPTESLNP